MGYEQIVLNLMKKLNKEDKFVLFILVLLHIENRCDKYLKFMLLIIFISGLEQGLLSK
ncbi:MAG: hypothetical protein K0R84_1000 [Clostridia bacterium]|jgi:hypothetical protein|nr:hypothetical protein [Clostridia bacterium]